MSKRKPSQNLSATLKAAKYNTRIIRSRNRILGTSGEQEDINNRTKFLIEKYVYVC
jgi:hypothetical protein